MKKTFIIVGLAIALAAGGAYGYKRHQRAELIELVTPAVKNASIRVTNSSKLDTDKTNITYKELFDRLEDDTAEIDKRSIEIQSVSNKDNAGITDPAVSYMKDCQEFSRALGMKYRKALALSNSLDSLRDANDEMRSSNSYSFEYAKKRSDRALKAMNEAIEEVSVAERDFVAAVRKLRDSRTKITGLFPEDALVEPARLDAVLKANDKPAKKAADDKSAS